MSNFLSLNFTNVSKHKECRIEIRRDEENLLSMLVFQGLVMVDKPSFGFEKASDLIKAFFADGYVFSNSEGSHRSSGCAETIEEAMNAYIKGVLNLTSYKAIKNFKSETSAPATSFNLNEADLSFSPNW